jgi:hypothetical protein
MSTTPLTPKLALAFELIAAAGAPIGSVEVASRYGCSYSHMMTLLRRCVSADLLRQQALGAMRDGR